MRVVFILHNLVPLSLPSTVQFIATNDYIKLFAQIKEIFTILSPYYILIYIACSLFRLVWCSILITFVYIYVIEIMQPILKIRLQLLVSQYLGWTRNNLELSTPTTRIIYVVAQYRVRSLLSSVVLGSNPGMATS